MAFGNPLIIENVEEEIDPVLDPVLNKEIQRKGRNLIIQLATRSASTQRPSRSSCAPSWPTRTTRPRSLRSSPSSTSP